MAFIEGWPHLRGGLYEGFHCKVNRGAGYGLEIPCRYHFFGSEIYIGRLITIIDRQ